MNDTESSPERDQTVLVAEVAALQKQVFVLLVALIVVTGTLTAYLYLQTTLLNKDLEAMREAVRPVVGNFQANQVVYQNFLEQLGTYAQTHPEFRPVLAKYGLTGAPPTAAPHK